MSRVLKQTVGKNKRIQSHLPGEERESYKNLSSVPYCFLFYFLEKHQKRQIEMDTNDHPCADHFDRKYLGTETPATYGITRSQSLPSRG
jgi:hypothetical protein